MKKFFIIILLLTLPTYAIKLSIGGSHLLGIHYEYELEEESFIDSSIGVFELGTVIFSTSHQFLYYLNGNSELYIGYGAMAITVPSIDAYMIAAKVPLGWRYTLDSGSILTLGIDLNYILGYTDDDGKWRTQMNIDSPLLPFPFVAYSF